MRSPSLRGLGFGNSRCGFSSYACKVSSLSDPLISKYARKSRSRGQTDKHACVMFVFRGMARGASRVDESGKELPGDIKIMSSLPRFGSYRFRFVPVRFICGSVRERLVVERFGSVRFLRECGSFRFVA